MPAVSARASRVRNPRRAWGTLGARTTGRGHRLSCLPLLLPVQFQTPHLTLSSGTCAVVRVSRSVMSNPSQPHGLEPGWPRNSPGKNTGVGSRSLLQGNLPNPGMEPRSPALQAHSLPLSEPPGKPSTQLSKILLREQNARQWVRRQQ